MADQKAVSRLTKSEALEELETLGAEVDFESEWDESTPVKDLRALVKEGREVLAEVEDEDEDLDEGEEANEEEEVDDEEEIEEDDSDEVAAGCHVFDARGNFVRAYTPERHGKAYAKLAKQFCAKSGREGYTVKTVK